MFNNLKNKIKTETGQDPLTIQFHNRTRHSVSSINSLSIDELSRIEEKDAEISSLKNELVQARSLIETLEDERKSLEHSIKAGQVQKEIFYDETDKIQDVQQQEIIKLKSMLLFREQESLDQLNKQKNDQQTIDHLKSEITRIKTIEPVFENVKDELENLRRASQMEKNQLITQLSAKDEEIRHIKTRLDISEQSRALFTSADAENDKIKLLLQERKMLENRLEEAHLHLYDIKSSWTSQNLTLENQLHRLSRQVAEETAEKRKAFEVKESLVEKLKQLEFELIKVRDELKQRDNKIKLMTEEIDELNSSLRDIRLENEEEIEFLRSKAAFQESELSQAGEKLAKSSEVREDQEKQILLLQKEKKELKAAVAIEIEEKSVILNQIHENNERFIQIQEAFEQLQKDLDDKSTEIAQRETSIEELKMEIEKLEMDLIDKTKAVKILNQRLFDVKKTLQEEIKNNNSGTSGTLDHTAPAILIPVNVDNNMFYQGSNISGRVYEMDEVKFSYLKHVILKFLTSREMEAKHLIRAISTLLYLSDSEEKLLTDTLDYRRSWFGTKPDVSFL